MGAAVLGHPSTSRALVDGPPKLTQRYPCSSAAGAMLGSIGWVKKRALASFALRYAPWLLQFSAATTHSQTFGAQTFTGATPNR